MKCTLTFLFTLAALAIFSQTIDCSLLTGTWIYHKRKPKLAANGFDKQYHKDLRLIFESDLTFIEESRYGGKNNRFSYRKTFGNYVLDTMNKNLSFKNLHYRNWCADCSDRSLKINGQDAIILSLDKHNLIILFTAREIPNCGLEAGTKYYYKRMK